jgi:acyl-CoA reductase-like NAD-dependent aldehyde dehydrogenase
MAPGASGARIEAQREWRVRERRGSVSDSLISLILSQCDWSVLLNPLYLPGPDTDVTHTPCSGPLISPASKTRVTGLINSCADEGGRIHLDGRNIQVPGYAAGNFVGPTILEGTVDMRCYRCVSDIFGRSGSDASDHAHSEEIFGPVLTVVTSDTLDDALSIINENKYGNGAVIFTQSGATARKFESEVNVGQVRLHSFTRCGGPNKKKHILII